MGDIGKMFFGGSEDARYVGNAPNYTPEQQAYLANLTNNLNAQIGTGVAPYGGQIAPGASPLQESAFDYVDRIMSGGNQNVNAADQAINDLLQPYDPASAQNFWKTSMVDPSLKNWEENIIPVIKENFIGQNAGRSGAANRAIAESGEDLMTNLSSQLGNLTYQGQQDWFGNQLNASNQSMNNILNQVGMAGTAGESQRSIEGDLMGELFNKWQYSQPYNNPWLNMTNSVLGAQAFEPMVQGPTQSSGLLQSVITPLAGSYMQGGGSGGIGGFFGSMFGGS